MGLTSNPSKRYNKDATNLSKSDEIPFYGCPKSHFWQKRSFFDQTNTRKIPLKPFFTENSSFTVFFTKNTKMTFLDFSGFSGVFLALLSFLSYFRQNKILKHGLNLDLF